MEENDLTNLSNEELLKKWKLAKRSYIWNAVFTGFFVGLTLYRLFTKGVSFRTFIPLIMIPILIKNRTNYKIIKEELKLRNLN